MNSEEQAFVRGDWIYSPDHRELCRVIEPQTLWGEIVCRVWLPGKDTVVRLPAACLRPVHEATVGTVDGIAYLAIARRKIPENVSRRSLTWHNEALSRYGDSESWK
jgi:phage terminase large subunit-like protein